MNNRLIVEIAPFKVIGGVDEKALLEASAEVQTNFLKKRSGFISRLLLKGKDNRWMDIVLWANQQEAEEAAKVVMNDPVCLKYFKLMDPASLNEPPTHFELVKEYK